MRNWFKNLNVSYQTALVSALALIVIIAGTSCLFFLNLSEVPFGIMLGGGVGILSYVILGIVTDREKVGAKPVGSIVVSIVRFLLLAVMIFLVAWLYYNQNIHIFNIFAVAGGYALPLVVLTILILMKGGARGNIR